MEALAKLGIDGWGLVLYLVNFGVLLLLLQKVAFKPLIKYLDERRDRIKEDVEQAALMRKELESEREKEEQARKMRMEEVDARIKEVKTVAREEAKNMLSEAGEQRDAILAQATKSANDTIAETISGAESEILDRVRKVVMHVLEKGVPEDVVEKSVKESWKTVTKSTS